VSQRTSELAITNQQLANSNQKLEIQTQELAKQKSSLELTNRDLEQATIRLQQQQTALVTSEKLATLGNLIVSVAHEINSPLGAIIGSYENLQAGIPQLLLELSNALHTMPENQMVAFWTVVETLRKEGKMLSSREERNRIDDLSTELANQGIANADEAARVFVKMGLPHPPQDALPPLFGSTSSDFLRYLSQLGSLWKQLLNIKVSSERAEKMVKALKEYARQRPDNLEKTRVKIDESVDLMLTIYRYHLMKNLELERDYQEVPEIACIPEHLYQVWTNLLMNASDAVASMEGFRGRLIVRIRRDENYVVVEFENNGPAIPERDLPRIFDWQFTTKGENGSGIGLAISRDIVNQHGGQLYVDSNHERTIFTVRLPING
jgi:signal transduction histidine kinase